GSTASPVWNRFQLFNEGVYSHDTHRLTTLLVCIPSAKESTLPGGGHTPFTLVLTTYLEHNGGIEIL
ncbi:MAG: hypothetical protein WBA57_05685, partial [Elainellaceae cyanobacterium]